MFRSLLHLHRLSRQPLLGAAGALHATRPLVVSAKTPSKSVEVTFELSGGVKHTAKGKVDQNLLDIVIDNEVDIDGFGACEGTLACSTCHLVFSKEDYKRLPDEPTDEELDMLDLAYGLTDTSRLGCQVYMTKDLSGIVVKVPEGVNDQR